MQVLFLELTFFPQILILTDRKLMFWGLKTENWNVILHHGEGNEGLLPKYKWWRWDRIVKIWQQKHSLESTNLKGWPFSRPKEAREPTISWQM